MDKKTKVLLIISAVLAAFIVFFIFQAFKQTKEVENISMQVQASGNESSGQCMNISTYEKEKCFASLAASTGNISFCESQIYEEGIIYTNSWKSSCYFETAIQKGNYSICDLVPVTDLSSPDNCYMNVVAKTKDKNICGNIKDNSTRDDCYQLKMLSER